MHAQLNRLRKWRYCTCKQNTPEEKLAGETDLSASPLIFLTGDYRAAYKRQRAHGFSFPGHKSALLLLKSDSIIENRLVLFRYSNSVVNL